MSSADLVHRNGLGSLLCHRGTRHVYPEGGYAAIDAALGLLIGKVRKEALHVVERGPAARASADVLPTIFG